MTNLTEQWKKGELPEGHYYVKDGGNMIAEYLDGYFYNDGQPMTSFAGGVDEVLAPVPSYNQWQQLKEYEQTVTSYSMKPIDYETACETVNKLLDEKKGLRQENTRLKENIHSMLFTDNVVQDRYDKAKRENAKLKDLLKEIRGKLHYINTPVNQHNIFSNDFIKRLDQVLGEE